MKIKKIIISIIFSLFSAFAFADIHNTINIYDFLMLGFNSHEVGEDNAEMSATKINLGIGIEYLYVFDCGFSFGANFTLLSEEYVQTSVDTSVDIGMDSSGFGYSIAPVIGWTFKNNTLIQLIDYPIIYEKANFSKNTARIGSLSRKIDSNTHYELIKTGLLASFEWGWTHFKLGVCCGTNFILADNYEDTFKGNFGIELMGGAKFTFLF